jgi:ornithine cyclodeaminase/alanine dehydrogenase-like protein (mu-crystallin family)
MRYDSTSGETALLDGTAVRSLLDWPEVLTAIRNAFIASTRQQALDGVAGQVDPPGGLLHLKAGGFTDPPLITVKANLRPDGERAFGVLLVFDHRERTLRAILDSGDVTAIRTAATALVAAQALGARDGATVAMVGAGPVGCRIAEALPHIMKPASLRLWSRDAEPAAELVATIPAGIPHQLFETAAEAVAGADVVFTCTPSRTPLLSAADLREDALVIAIGADSPGKRELAADVLADALLIADEPVAARRVGEYEYLPDDAPAPLALGQVLLDGASGLGPASGRRTVFDTVGTAFTDAAVADVIVRSASRQNLGHTFTFRDIRPDAGSHESAS